MKSYEEVYEVVKQTLSKERLIHSENVMKRCVEFAKLYGEDVEKAKLVGIAHDITKEIPKAERVFRAEQDGTILDDFEKEHMSLIHAKHGAVVCKKEFGFSDDMCDAVSYHTTGKANMSKLEKILYLSDFSEEGRDFPEAIEAYQKGKLDLDEGYFYALSQNIKFLVDDRKPMHKNSIDAFNYMLTK